MSTRYIRFNLLLAVCFSLSLLCGACASSSNGERKKSIREYEEGFDPARYRDKLQAEREMNADPVRNTIPDTETKEEYITIERIEKTTGFRVQLFSTTSLDDAEQRRDDYKESLGDSTAVTIVFDAPYYKVRAGNYLSKPEADEECKRLKELGLQEAWVVRDKVDRIVSEKIVRKQ